MPFDIIVREMKEVGETLVPHNYPLVPSHVEQKYEIYKMREITIDGYDVILHYNKSDYGDFYSQTLQILSLDMPFLPFYLVIKIGKKFFGENYLALIEFFKDSKKVYCWNVNIDKEGNVMPSFLIDESEHCVFEGTDYIYITDDKVNFY